MSSNLTSGGLSFACKRINKAYSPFSFSILDGNHEGNVDYAQRMFLLAEQLNNAFANGDLDLRDDACTLTVKESEMGYRCTTGLRPALMYGKQPFILQRLAGEPYLLSFEIEKREEQYCPNHIAQTLKEMAIEAAKNDIDFIPMDERSTLFQNLEKGENPHSIPKIKNIKTHTFIINVKENVIWTKQEANRNLLLSTFTKVLHKIVRSFCETDYNSKARLQSAYESMIVSETINVRAYPDYASVERGETSGGFRVHSLVEYLAGCEKDMSALDATCTAQLTGLTDAKQKTTFKDSLNTFVFDDKPASENKFNALLSYAEAKYMEVSEVRLQVAIEADESLYEYIDNWLPHYIPDESLGKELSAECKVAGVKGNMKLELTNSDEFKKFMDGVYSAYQENEEDESVSLTRAENISLGLVADGLGMLLSCLHLYIDLLHDVKKRDEDLGGFADRYEKQKMNG